MHKIEKIYDEKISPLMAEIIKICKENDIPFYADFAISDKQNESCSSGLLDMPIYEMLHILRRCAVEDGVNIDKFLIWLSKNKNESSSIMDKAFENGEWRKPKLL